MTGIHVDAAFAGYDFSLPTLSLSALFAVDLGHLGSSSQELATLNGAVALLPGLR